MLKFYFVNFPHLYYIRHQKVIGAGESQIAMNVFRPSVP